jgi:hypothetical protein
MWNIKIPLVSVKHPKTQRYKNHTIAIWAFNDTTFAIAGFV